MSPRRVLILGDKDSGVLPLLKDLTGSSPTPQPLPESDLTGSNTSPQDATSTAGLTHVLDLENAYYTASIPIWLDETSTPAEWKTGFLSEEAGEVVRAVGAWVVVFKLPGNEAERLYVQVAMKAIKQIISQAHEGDDNLWDGICIAVGWPNSVVGKSGKGEAGAAGHAMAEEVLEWEDECLEYGFEFIDGRRGSKRDSHGELGGIARLREALEANDWASSPDVEFMDDEEIGEFQTGLEDDIDFGEMKEELLALKLDIGPNMDAEEEEDEALQVKSFEALVEKMMAVREMTSHLPEDERKKTAAKAVNKIMKTV